MSLFGTVTTTSANITQAAQSSIIYVNSNATLENGIKGQPGSPYLDMAKALAAVDTTNDTIVLQTDITQSVNFDLNTELFADQGILDDGTLNIVVPLGIKWTFSGNFGIVRKTNGNLGNSTMTLNLYNHGEIETTATTAVLIDCADSAAGINNITINLNAYGNSTGTITGTSLANPNYLIINPVLIDGFKTITASAGIVSYDEAQDRATIQNCGRIENTGVDHIISTNGVMMDGLYINNIELLYMSAVQTQDYRTLAVGAGAITNISIRNTNIYSKVTPSTVSTGTIVVTDHTNFLIDNSKVKIDAGDFPCVSITGGTKNEFYNSFFVNSGTHIVVQNSTGAVKFSWVNYDHDSNEFTSTAPTNLLDYGWVQNSDNLIIEFPDTA